MDAISGPSVRRLKALDSRVCESFAQQSGVSMDSGYDSFVNSDTDSFSRTNVNQNILFSTPRPNCGKNRSSFGNSNNFSLNVIEESPIKVKVTGKKALNNFVDFGCLRENRLRRERHELGLSVSIGNISNKTNNVLKQIQKEQQLETSLDSISQSNYFINLFNNENSENQSPFKKVCQKSNSLHQSDTNNTSNDTQISKEILKLKKKQCASLSKLKTISSKRKLDIPKEENKSYKRFYNVIENVSILEKLEPYSLVLNKIFHLIPDEDIYNLSLTSQKLKDIIQSNHQAKNRLCVYLSAIDKSKENHLNVKIVNNLVKNDSNRSLFGLHNASLTINKKPPISPYTSPSKRKFYENQKVVKTLTVDEKLIKCPICGKESRIFNGQLTENDLNHSVSMNTALKNLTNQLHSTSNVVTSNKVSHNNISDFFTSSASLTRIDNSNCTAFLNHSTVETSYGECTGKSCKFKFCLKCLCEYHYESTCKVSKSISPTKEDVENGYLQIDCSHIQGRKKNRKFLKRLFLD